MRRERVSLFHDGANHWDTARVYRCIGSRTKLTGGFATLTDALSGISPSSLATTIPLWRNFSRRVLFLRGFLRNLLLEKVSTWC